MDKGVINKEIVTKICSIRLKSLISQRVHVEHYKVRQQHYFLVLSHPVFSGRVGDKTYTFIK
jgi:hypothetical protein